MRVVRNDVLIKKRTQFTQRGSLIGMGILLVSLLFSSRNILVSYLFLIVGFVIAMAAVRVGNRYVRPPRRDLVLDKLLKGLGNKYALFHYIQPAEQLLLTPGGLVAILMREQQGQVSVRGKRWAHGPFMQKLRLLVGESGLGNPAQELRQQIAATSQALAGVEGVNGSVPIEGIIVFYADKVTLDAQDPEFPVVLAGDLKATLRTMDEGRPSLSDRTRKLLTDALQGKTPATEEES